MNTFSLSDFTNATINPDGSRAPKWLSKAPSELKHEGPIGFQGKHGGAPIHFRNIEILEL